jgi:protease I
MADMADRSTLLGKRVAILVDDGFEQVELEQPRKALEEAGAETVIVSPKEDVVKGWQHDKWGDQIDVDLPLDKAHPEDFDALLLPGGVMNPDHLRMNEHAVEFVKDFFVDEKPVAAICHGPWMLVQADVVRGRHLTSWPSLHTDLENAGAKWTDREVVVDGNLVTSRKPDDIPAFNKAMIEEFADYVPKDGPREAIQSRAFSDREREL